jgi:nitrite reductase (NADH) large subunit
MSGNSGKAWICLVCGYVHRGDEPPETCAVCGADQSDFELFEEAKPATPAAQPRQWRCLVCGYIHEGPEPPSECPICSATADDFEPLEAASAPATASGAAVRVVVVGGGIAGVAAVEAARQTSAEAEITLLSKEPDLPYYRLNLSRLVAGEIGEEALPLHPRAWYEEQRIRLLCGAEVVTISPEDQTVRLSDGTALPFDRLILACGAHAFIPPFPGAALDGVSALRSLADARRILNAAKPGAHCVCIGGGILGLETAGALAKRGMHVTVLEGGDWLMPRQLDRAAGELLGGYVAAQGITVRYRAKTAEVLGEGVVRGVRLADGATLPADLVVIATGVRPDTHLARKAGLTVNQGIVVDTHLTTSHPKIFAAGDVAEYQGIAYGLWEPARHQGAIAGMNAAGASAEFGGLPRANTLKVLGIALFSVGVVQPQDGSYEEVAEEVDGRYHRFLFRDQRLVGAIFLGDTSLSALATTAIKNQTDFSGVLRGARTVAAVMDSLRSV